MRVNIKGVWYDSKSEPIQIQVSDSDKKNIADMLPSADNYVTYPDTMTWEEVKEVLKINQ